LIGSGLVDAVDICLPHHLHAAAIVAAADAGKHVLCEKPLCLTVDEATKVARAVATSGITLMCAHNQLYLAPVRRARELIREGRLGAVYTARTTDSFFHTFDPSTIGWRADRATSGGGELIDTGYHPTYLLLHLIDSQPVEVASMLSRHRLDFMEGEDSAQVLVRFADGSVGTIETSWAYEPAGSTEKFSVVGDRGSLWSDGRGLIFKPRGGEPVAVVEPARDGPHTIALEVADFVAGLRHGRRPLDTEVEGIAVPEGDPGGICIGRAEAVRRAGGAVARRRLTRPALPLCPRAPRASGHPGRRRDPPPPRPRSQVPGRDRANAPGRCR